MSGRYAAPRGAWPRRRRAKFAAAAVAVATLLVLPASAAGPGFLPGVGRMGEPGAQSLTVTPVADTYADSLAQDRNFGERTLLRLNQERKYTRIIYLAFEVAGIPDDAEDVRATLALSPTVSRSFAVRASLTDPFDEAALTWRDRPPVGEMLAETDPPEVGRPVVLDVTDAVDGNGGVNLALTAAGPIQASTWFPSSEAALDLPELEVTWTGAPTEPEPTPTPTPEPTPTPTPQPTAPTPTPTPSSPAKPPPPAGGSGGEDPMLVGSTVWYHDGRTSIPEELEYLESRVGRLEIRRVYDSGFDRDFTNRAGLDIGKRTTHYSFKPDMSALARGALDADIRALLDSIPAGHPTILTVWHEPENDFQSDAQKADYRKGWQRFAQLVKAQDRPELSTSWVMMAYSFRAMSGREPMDWWPGDGVVDIVGIDTYNEGSLKQSEWDSPGREFGQPAPGDAAMRGGFVDGGILAFLQRHDAKLGIAEFGSLENTTGITADWTDTPTKAEWIRQAVEYYHSLGAIYVEYFHAGPYRGPWWLDNDSDEPLEMYRELIERF